MTPTIESMIKDARELGAASARTHGMKVSVSYIPAIPNHMKETFVWMVNDEAGNEDSARQCLAEMAAMVQRAGPFPHYNHAR